MIRDEALLVASHIKPWKDSDDEEKVDPNNGFIFTPTYDRLFDKGLISFEDDGKLLVSDELDCSVITALELKAGVVLTELNITEACKEYLEYHRTHIFKKKASD